MVREKKVSGLVSLLKCTQPRQVCSADSVLKRNLVMGYHFFRPSRCEC